MSRGASETCPDRAARPRQAMSVASLSEGGGLCPNLNRDRFRGCLNGRFQIRFMYSALFFLMFFQVFSRLISGLEKPLQASFISGLGGFIESPTQPSDPHLNAYLVTRKAAKVLFFPSSGLWPREKQVHVCVFV